MTAVASASKTRSRTPVLQGIKDTWVITKRNLLRNIRLPQLLILSTVQPVMFLLLFTYVFGGAIGQALPAVAQGEYLNWLVPGLLIQFAAFGAGQTAIGLTDDLSKGVIDRFRSLPMARSAVLAGRTVADTLRSSVVAIIMLTVAFLLGFRWQTSIFGMIGGLLVAGVFAFSLSWVMATIGLTVKDPESAQAAVFLPVFPLVFASSVFVPTGTMPGWLQAFADNQPITVVVNALRGLILGEGALPPGQTTAGQVLLALVWSLAILAVFAPLAVRIYRRTVG
ncbi:MAG: ABC transporter permease [Acidimicrobiia bacterium]|nr:ABC transporter permease [Acidimicrobiia bacterium]MBT8214848.1 ABC transporter permease [Acidimicrobiia bacterium]NNK90935.1 ABC transporter permease [Acidimicrobiia bacterium]